MSHILDRGTSREEEEKTWKREDRGWSAILLLRQHYAYSSYTDIMHNAFRSVSLRSSHTAYDISRDPREFRLFSFLLNRVSSHVPSSACPACSSFRGDFRYCRNEALFPVERPSRSSLIKCKLSSLYNFYIIFLKNVNILIKILWKFLNAKENFLSVFFLATRNLLSHNWTYF